MLGSVARAYLRDATTSARHRRVIGRMSLHLKLFGGLSLIENETGAVRVTRRHRLATLAVLASADRPVPRERLLALLWPDSSDEGGRHSLGQVLYGLKQDLGVDAISGATDLVLQRNSFDCDLWIFRDAIAARDYERALGVYAGPFLDGVHFPAADQFERWCEEERGALARQAREAIESLATAADARADSAEAVRRWRQLAAADPISSRVALSLMRALVASGDRAAAVQHARTHAAIVKAELEVDADPAVLAFAEELKVAQPAILPAPKPVVSAPPIAVEEPALSTEAPRHTHPWRGWVPAAAVIVLAIVAARSVLSRRSDSERTPGIPVLAVLPFDIRGDTARAFLGEALSALLSTRLDAPGVLRTLESNAVLNAIGRHGGSTGAEADSRVIGIGANVLVHGTVVVLGDHLEIDAELREPNGSDHRVLRATVSGSVDSLFSLADQLGVALLVAREGRTLGNSIVGGTVSVPALKAFLSGERALREWRLGTAMTWYRDAVRIDSSYAMAWYRLAFSQAWAKEGDGGAAARAKTRELAAQLPPRQALLLDAMHARDIGDYAGAERGLLTLVQRYADDADPWAELGEFRMHVGPLLGHPTSDAEAPLVRALSLDSASHPEVRHHLIQLALERGDIARGHALLAPLLAKGDPSDRTVQFLRVMMSLADNSIADTAGLVRSLREMPPGEANFLIRTAIYSTGVTPFARAIVDSLAATTDSRGIRTAGLTIVQEIAVARAQWTDVVAAGAALAALDSIGAAESWSDIASSLDAKIPVDEWRRAGDVLERAARADTSPVGWLRRLASARLAVRASDEPAFARRMQLLTARGHSSPRFVEAVHVVQAMHADAMHDSLGVVRELDAIGDAIDSPTGRWLRARSLERANQLEVASRWYLSTPWGPDGIVLTRSAYEHASTLAAARGNRAEANRFTTAATRFGGGSR